MRLYQGWAALAATIVCGSAGAEPAGRITAHVWGEPAAALPAIQSGVTDSYGSDGRLTYKPIATLMPEATDDAGADLKKADGELDEGDKSFSGMELEPAKQHLANAVQLYSARLPELIKRDKSTDKLKTTWLLFAKVYFFDGDTTHAREALRHCLTLEPTLDFSPARFPPQMKKLVAEVRAAYVAGGNGRVVVESVPPGATIYVDGVARPEPAPQTIVLPNGPHDFRLDLAGHKPVVETVEAPPRDGQSKLAAALPEAPSRADALLGAALTKLDEPTPPPALADAAKQLDVDLLALVRVTTATAPGRVALKGWLYDARRKLMLKRVSRESSAADNELKLNAGYFAHDLTTGVRLDGTLEPPPHRDTFADKWTRFRESKYFWPVVGAVGGAVLAGAAVGIGVGISHQRNVDDDVTSAVILTGGK